MRIGLRRRRRLIGSLLAALGSLTALGALVTASTLAAPARQSSALSGADDGVRWAPGPTLAHPDQPADAGFGTVLALGDVNDDGAVDILVGAPLATVAGVTEAGQVLIFLAPDFDAVRVLADPQPTAGARFGAAIVVADLDADGHAEIVVGAPSPPLRFGVPALPGRPVVPSLHGRVFIFGGPDFAGTRILQVAEGPKAFGFAGALAVGDVTGDGRPDLVVGDTHPFSSVFRLAPNQPLEDPTEEGVHIFAGPGFEERRTLAKQPCDGFSCWGFGAAVAIGDVDGDGLGDVFVGDPYSRDFAISRGAVQLFRAPQFAPGVRLLALPATQFVSNFGRSLAIADLDGDGTADLVVGDPTSPAGSGPPTGSRRQSGAVAVFTGLAGPGEPTRRNLAPVASEIDARFGSAVAAGDVDGDGRPDIVAGGHAPADHLAVFLGPTFASAGTLDGVTGTVLAVGDLNRDGRADLVALAPGERVRVFFSMPGDRP